VNVGDCKGSGGSGACGMPESVYPLFAIVEYDGWFVRLEDCRRWRGGLVIAGRGVAAADYFQFD